MHKLTFFPLGNADCTRIELEGGKTLLIDYAATKTADTDDKRCDLPKELGQADYEVVAFTHLDRDHFQGFSDYFYLEHASKYQGEDRAKIKTLWVPAAVLTESQPDDSEARILQKEARYRFRQSSGIRVFSRPKRLEDWCKRRDIDLDERRHLFTDAGKVAPEFSLDADGAEFFVHSPFAVRQNDRSLEDRNGDSLILNCTLQCEGYQTNVLLLNDAAHESLSDIIGITESHDQEARLRWDVVKLPHHCSYLSLSATKGEDKTSPDSAIERLYVEYGQMGGLMISTSKPIPTKGTPEDDDVQPPHRQAAAFYKSVASSLGGQFVVTMEHPTTRAPKPIVVEVTKSKARLKKETVAAGTYIASRPAPRAG